MKERTLHLLKYSCYSIVDEEEEEEEEEEEVGDEQLMNRGKLKAAA
jgi:hypothetical protein